jgi:hypothetical protein
MHATPEPGPARSAAAVNEEIRALWLRAKGRLSPEQRLAYERLVTEWSAAMRESQRCHSDDQSAEVA